MIKTCFSKEEKLQIIKSVLAIALGQEPEPNTVFSNPFRRDRKPSMVIQLRIKNTSVREPKVVDLSNNKIYSPHEIVEEVKLRYNLKGSYITIANRLLKGQDQLYEKYKLAESETNKEIIINKVSPTKEFLEYFDQWDISLEVLQKYEVHCINSYSCGNSFFYTPTLSIAYVEPVGIKILKPYHKHKWLNNMKKDVVLGLQQIVEANHLNKDLLIITKARKEAMLYYHLGIASVWTVSETVYIPDKRLNKLKNAYPHVVAVFDNDPTGVKAAKYYEEKSIPSFFFEEKNITDEYEIDADKALNILWSNVKLITGLSKDEFKPYISSNPF